MTVGGRIFAAIRRAVLGRTARLRADRSVHHVRGGLLLRRGCGAGDKLGRPHHLRGGLALRLGGVPAAGRRAGPALLWLTTAALLLGALLGFSFGPVVMAGVLGVMSLGLLWSARRAGTRYEKPLLSVDWPLLVLAVLALPFWAAYAWYALGVSRTTGSEPEHWTMGIDHWPVQGALGIRWPRPACCLPSGPRPVPCWGPCWLSARYRWVPVGCWVRRPRAAWTCSGWRSPRWSGACSSPCARRAFRPNRAAPTPADLRAARLHRG